MKAKTLEFYSIHCNFIRGIRAKFGIPNLSQFPDIGQNPVTKLDKRNKNPFKKSDDDVISENYNVIVIFSYLLAI